MNATFEPVKIYPNQCIGHIFSSDTFNVLSNGEPTSIETVKSIPEHVQPLIDSIPDETSPEIKEKLIQLLVDYQHIFSAGKHDLGLTDLIEQTIDIRPGEIGRASCRERV